MSGLPVGWAETTIGALFDVVGGGTPSRSVDAYWTGSTPWITSADISDDGTIEVRRHISDAGVAASATNVVLHDSVIVVTRVGLGKVARAPEDIAFSQDCQALPPLEGINPEFLRLQLSRTAQSLRAMSRGTTISGVTKKQLLDLRLSIPPVREQERIVAAIEEQFSRLDAGGTAVERARKNLKRYRRTVLNTTSSQKRGWVRTTIGAACECLDSRRKPVNKSERLRRPGTIPYYGANGRVGSIDDYLFDEPLVLVVEDETFTGREKPFSYKITGKAWVNNHAHVLRPGPGVDIDFLNFALSYYPFTALTTGTTGRKKLTKAALLAAPLTLPSKDEQEGLVTVIADRLRLAERLETEIGRSLQRAAFLRRSVLESAFSGKLVPQDPDDEPASVLLERIAAERASSNGHKLAKARRQRRAKVTT